MASPNPGDSISDNDLYGVAATSAPNAWAVGAYKTGTTYHTLVLHWNGTHWTKVVSPDPGGSSEDNLLNGVAAGSTSHARAGGYYNNGTAPQTLAIRCC